MAKEKLNEQIARVFIRREPKKNNLRKKKKTITKTSKVE